MSRTDLIDSPFLRYNTSWTSNEPFEQGYGRCGPRRTGIVYVLRPRDLRVSTTFASRSARVLICDQNGSRCSCYSSCISSLFVSRDIHRYRIFDRWVAVHQLFPRDQAYRCVTSSRVPDSHSDTSTQWTEAVTRSPVYSLVNECLTGVTSIRAYSDSSRFTGKLFNLVDDTNRPFFSLWLINRWLSVRSDFGGATVALVAALFIVMTPSVSASLAGFALTCKSKQDSIYPILMTRPDALIMEERILWIVRLYASTQIVFNAVERIREYTLDISQEPQGGREPPAQWPSSQPSIQIENLVVRYAEHLDPALKGISLDVKPSVGLHLRTREHR